MVECPFDVTNAFLHCNLEDDIYMEVHLGLKLRKEHYGLKQSPKAWFDKFTIVARSSAEVRTISLFGEVWGIGPSTALKLYEKGHRSLDDLRNDGSLTNAQKLGLKYFDDIRQRIPRHEVCNIIIKEMEHILQKAGEEVLPGVSEQYKYLLE
ncbi:hypothetical protein V8G54_011458 [Vigna mungo]|uniref:DNA polymerase lambda fingers domain-containing protein n=1 Tax=Vigna mungo TaxID=3915 RepID=A0AAQ3S1A0_VIGMU